MVAKGAAEVMSLDVGVGEGVYEKIQYLRQDNVDLELPLERETGGVCEQEAVYIFTNYFDL